MLDSTSTSHCEDNLHFGFQGMGEVIFFLTFLLLEELLHGNAFRLDFVFAIAIRRGWGNFRSSGDLFYLNSCEKMNASGAWVSK